MSAYGIAGLVDGFFKGRQIKHGWEDRKDQKKRQETQDGYTASEQQRIAERHGWARDQYGRSVSDYERGRADDDAYRRASQEAIDATEAAMAGGGQDPATVTPSTMGAPPPAGPTSEAAARLPGAVDATTRRSAAADQFERFFDPNNLGAAPPPVAGGPPAGPRRADVMPEDTRGLAIQEARDTQSMPPRTIEDMRAQAIAEARAMQDAAGGAQAAPAVAPQQPPAAQTEQEYRLKTLPDGTRIAPAPSAAIADELGAVRGGAQGVRYLPPEEAAQADRAAQDGQAQPTAMENFASMVAPSDFQYEWGSKGLPGDAREAGIRATSALGAVPRAVVGATGMAGDALRSAVNPALKYATGGDDGYELPMQSYAPGAPPRPAPAASADVTPERTAAAQPAPAPAAGPGPRISNVPANAPPVVKQLAAVADQAMGEASTPAVEAAAAAVAKDDPALGAAGNRPYSEKQRERASTAFMDRYMEVGAPIVIKEYLRRGEVDKAIKFQEFLDAKETKAGMKNWARASFAASVGDFDSFASEVMEGYNRLDYFGDDTTIVTTESGFTDAEGNITKDNRSIAGAKIVFKDERTGKTFEQVYDSPADIVTMGVTLLAPEEAFEYWMKKTDAAREAALGAAKAGAEKEDKTAESIRKLTDTIVEGSKDLAGVAQISRADARRQATAEIAAGTGDLPEDDPLGAPPGPPVLRRP